MGIILNGILGGVSGKVSGVVGGKWKDKNYLRAYVKPANPNTASQQVQRSLFSRAVDFAKILVGQVFNVYTDKFQKSMSGFNFFIKRNITEFTAPPSYENLLITEGKLFVTVVSVFTAAEATDTAHIEWNTDLGANGAAGDKVYGFVYNETQNLYAFFAAEEVRSDGGTGVDITIDIAAADECHAYVWPAQYVDSVLTLIGNSSYKDATGA